MRGDDGGCSDWLQARPRRANQNAGAVGRRMWLSETTSLWLPKACTRLDHGLCPLALWSFSPFSSFLLRLRALRRRVACGGRHWDGSLGRIFISQRRLLVLALTSRHLCTYAHQVSWWLRGLYDRTYSNTNMHVATAAKRPENR